MSPRNRKINVTELEGVAASHEVTLLSQKLDKCYSKDRYEDFQSAVRKIITEALDIAHIEIKIKKIGKEGAKDYLEKKGWEQKTFWIPTIISVITGLIALAAYFKP
jgi:hypothetical protein